jgi:hypothetical protein
MIGGWGRKTKLVGWMSWLESPLPVAREGRVRVFFSLNH